MNSQISRRIRAPNTIAKGFISSLYTEFCQLLKGILMFRQLGAEADGGTAHLPQNITYLQKR